MKGIKEKVYRAWKTGTYPSPATKTLGIKIIELSEGRSLVEMQIDEHLHNMSATMHGGVRSEEHTSELQSRPHLVCRLLLEKKKKKKNKIKYIKNYKKIKVFI